MSFRSSGSLVKTLFQYVYSACATYNGTRDHGWYDWMNSGRRRLAPALRGMGEWLKPNVLGIGAGSRWNPSCEPRILGPFVFKY
ncbi:MAG: hypothetical protein RLY70_2463 [Planctomycetota bacterium]